MLSINLFWRDGVGDYSGEIFIALKKKVNDAQFPLLRNIESLEGYGQIKRFIRFCPKCHELEKHSMLL